MGVKQSPNISQEVMESLFRDLDKVDVYIDNVGIFSDTWQEHLDSLGKVLAILEKHNFSVNPLKCEWGVKETNWLGYWLTPVGLKPRCKKIDAILALERLTTVSQLRSFIGAVTFYRDMYPHCAHTLAPLTALVGKKKLHWSKDCEKAFHAVKALLSKDALIRYPDHNRPFHIYCDASDLQLGSVIMQDGHPVAFYSRKLSSAQKNYTVGEKELLSIVETLKEYCSMLLGCRELHVHTDHKNLTYHKLSLQRVLQWWLYLEEYNPIFHYIKGKKNVLADALSRMPFLERQNSRTTIVPNSPADNYQLRVMSASAAPSKDAIDSIQDPLNLYHSMVTDKPSLLDCFVHLPESSGTLFVLDYSTIAEAQGRDASLQQLAKDQPKRYAQQLLAPGTMVFCYIPGPDVPWKIYLPQELLDNAIQWYHLALGHIGMNRLHDTISMHFFHKDLRNRIEDIVSRCNTCQHFKQAGRSYGETAPWEAVLSPWREIACDLIGPWKLDVGNQLRTFSALTIIDTVTNLVEIVRLDNHSAAHVALHFENTWLSRYPKPVSCIYDQGGEFTGFHFQQMLKHNNIKAQPILAKNPQANAICKWMHQSIGNTLWAFNTLQPPVGITNTQQLVDTAIANAVFAARATVHSALQTTPSGLAFGRNMVLDIPLVADLELIRQQRQQLIDNRLIAANRRRFSHDYSIGDEVLKLHYKPNKLDPRATGPYKILRVHTNGTLTIRLSPTVVKRISIQRVKPYRQ